MAYATTSSWVATLEDWFGCTGLSLISPPQVATWTGHEAQCPSILDLFLANDITLAYSPFSPVHVSFEDLLGSDHALLASI
jgi:hypothetical protein